MIYLYEEQDRKHGCEPFTGMLIQLLQLGILREVQGERRSQQKNRRYVPSFREAERPERVTTLNASLLFGRITYYHYYHI